MGHARTLINIDDPKKQIKVYYRIIDSDLSVRSTEELVRSLQAENLRDPSKGEKKKKLNDDFAQLSGHLEKIFASKVNFRINEKGKGKIVIQFDNPEEMERILGIFDRLNS
jgi:ParB family chromosome partitioning protein